MAKPGGGDHRSLAQREHKSPTQRGPSAEHD